MIRISQWDSHHIDVKKALTLSDPLSKRPYHLSVDCLSLLSSTASVSPAVRQPLHLFATLHGLVPELYNAVTGLPCMLFLLSSRLLSPSSAPAPGGISNADAAGGGGGAAGGRESYSRVLTGT